MAKEEKRKEPEVIGGTLDVLGLKIDLGKLLSSSGEAAGQLEKLRDKLKQAGLKETVSDADWKAGRPAVSGHIRTRGVLGDREYHFGTAEEPSPTGGRKASQKAAEPVEPATDVFYEAEEVVVVAEVPGVGEADLDFKVDGRAFALSTRPGGRRTYSKSLTLDVPVKSEGLKATCRNGILEVHLKRG